ncbi:hypothetical protein A3B39_01470, partial [Candidatus Daviesbacteria bacterium RIFCSPLOWO2_01_FULL_37_10]
IFLKIIENYKIFEGKKAYPWIKKYMGERSLQILWNPLLQGKFGKYKEDIALTWFWARIKKRTPSLAYPEGGFQVFANKLAAEIKKMGGKIQLNTEVMELVSAQDVNVKFTVNNKPLAINHFDKVIVTLPSPIFIKISQNLPESYVKRIRSIPHLYAQVLILTLKKPFMDKTYWLNVTDKKFPFLVLVEHTNFMDKKYYGNQHILYIGNYLPQNHPYLKMPKEELLKVFMPYLKKINSQKSKDFSLPFSILNSELFTGPFAQPVVTTEYLKLIPEMKTPIKNVYLANLDMVYPWDRGTNYAIELGEQVAKLI